MPKFKRKPKTIEARQFTGGEQNANELVKWIADNGGEAKWWEGREANGSKMKEELHVFTDRGVRITTPGNWVTFDPKKGFKPMPDAVLAEDYNKVGGGTVVNDASN